MTSTMRVHTAVLLADLAAWSGGGPFDLFRAVQRFPMEVFEDMGFGLRLRAQQTTTTSNSEQEHPFQLAFDGAHHAITMRFVQPQWLWKAKRQLNVGSETELRRNPGGRGRHSARHHSGRAREARWRRCVGRQEHRDAVLGRQEAGRSRRGPGLGQALRAEPAVPPGRGGQLHDRRPRSHRPGALLAHLAPQPAPGAGDQVREELAKELSSLSPSVYSTDSRPDGADDQVVPTVAQVSSLSFLDAVIRETLRLHPPVPASTKDAAEDVVIDGDVLIPKGSTSILAFYAMARMESVWGPDAKEFKPKRWLVDGRLRQVSASQYPVFNAGPRRCLGEAIALLELKVVAAALFRAFHFEVRNSEQVKYAFTLTLPMQHGSFFAKVSQA